MPDRVKLPSRVSKVVKITDARLLLPDTVKYPEESDVKLVIYTDMRFSLPDTVKFP